MAFLTNYGDLDPNALYRRRAIADALQAQSISGTPQNWGQGITAISQALFGAIGDRRLQPHEDRARSEAAQQLAAMLGGGGMAMGGSAPSGMTTGTPLQGGPGADLLPPTPNMTTGTPLQGGPGADLLPPPATQAFGQPLRPGMQPGLLPPPPTRGAPVPPVATTNLTTGEPASRLSLTSTPVGTPPYASAPAGEPLSVSNVLSGGGGPTSVEGGAGADTLGAGLPPSLVNSESGGNWNALNSEGYGGRGQFGEDRLRDAYNAGVIPRPMTGAEYSRAPQELQIAVENWHRADILGDLGRYVGTDVDGGGPIPPLTEDSILAVAHLGGTNGARRFIESGGRYDPADSNGTNLSDYARMHAGGGMTGGGGSSAMVGQAGGDRLGGGFDPQTIQQLAELLGNPYLGDGQRAVAQALLGQQMGGMDPMRALELERAQLEIDLLRNPRPEPVSPTTLMREYEVAVQQGYQGTLLDYQTAVEGAGAPQTNVSVGGGEFTEEASKLLAQNAMETVSQGQAASRGMGELLALEAALQNAPQGMGGGIALWANSLGIATDGADDAALAQAIINRLVPGQRPPGSGPMSDADLNLFKASLPSLLNQPGGNSAILSVLKNIAQYDMDRAEIAQQLVIGRMTPEQAFAAYNALPHPIPQDLLARLGQGAMPQPTQGATPTVRTWTPDGGLSP